MTYDLLEHDRATPSTHMHWLGRATRPESSAASRRHGEAPGAINDVIGCGFNRRPEATGELSAPIPTIWVVNPTPARLARQATFDELGTPLAEVTFVVVDLETTGGSPAHCGITEIGARQVLAAWCGGVPHDGQPGSSIPPFIQVLTGITDAMVAASPAAEQMLPGFLEFARGCVLWRTTPRYDVGFLRAAAERSGRDWPTSGRRHRAPGRQVGFATRPPDCSSALRCSSHHDPNHRPLITPAPRRRPATD